jgi:hypothetical protein
MTRRAAWVVGLAATAALVGAGPAEARPKLHDGATGYKVRPATILVSGDGTGWLGGEGAAPPGDYGTIHWTRFRRSGAVGHGRIFIGNCEPDCAGGGFSSWPATIRATRVRKRHFTRLQARYERDGETVVTRWRLHVASPTYAYWMARPG